LTNTVQYGLGKSDGARSSEVCKLLKVRVEVRRNIFSDVVIV